MQPELSPAGGPPAGRVGGESAGLGVFEPADGEPGVDRIRMGHNSAHVVRDQDIEDPPKNRHAASHPSMTASNVWETSTTQTYAARTPR